MGIRQNPTSKLFEAPSATARINRAHPLARHLLGYWPMLERGGGMTHDYSRRHSHGTLTNMTQSAWGHNSFRSRFSGPSLSFSGNTGRIDTAKQYTTNVAVSLWCNFPSTNDWDSLCGQASSDAMADGFGFHFLTNHLYFYVAHYVNNKAAIVNIPTNTWYHIVGTYDGWNVTIYANSVRGTTDAYTGGVTQASRVFSIGQIGGAGFTTFQGTICNVALFSQGLSDLDVQELYGNPWTLFQGQKFSVSPPPGSVYVKPAAATARASTVKPNLNVGGSWYLNPEPAFAVASTNEPIVIEDVHAKRSRKTYVTTIRKKRVLI